MGILQTTEFSWVVLLVNEATLDPARAVWHMPATCALAPKRAEKQYFILTKGAEFLFTHSALMSPVEAATERTRQQHPRATPVDKEAKHLELLGRNGFPSLQF